MHWELLLGFFIGGVVGYPLGWMTGDWVSRWLTRRKAIQVAQRGYDRDVRMKDADSRVVSYVRLP